MKYLLGCFALFLFTGLSSATETPIEKVSDLSHYVQNPDQRGGVSLNGSWSYIIDPYENGYYNHRYQPYAQGYFQNKKKTSPEQLIEYDFDAADTLMVPGDWNTQKKELMFYEGTIWYHKEFQFNKEVDKRYVVNFGAVNYNAIIYVNGQKIGRHEGGFTSFQFDISEALSSGNNFITVKVDNRRERDQVPTVNTDWWNYGGITREVKILSLPKSHIENYQIQVNSNNTQEIQGQLWITNPSASLVTVSIPELGVNKKIKVNKSGEISFMIAASPRLWSPRSPKLYDVELSYNGESIKDKIGFRTITTEGDKIKLNGQNIFLKGISLHEESPITHGRAWSEADARILLTWAKELGCNFVRLAHYPHNEMMLRVADELGLMVWSEIPVYWTVMFDNEEVYQKAELQLVEMIQRDINRASIVLWSVANETPNSRSRLSFLTKLIDKLRSIDSSRLITAAMDTHSSSANGIVIDDPLITSVDVIGINNYCGWYYSHSEKCADLVWQSPSKKPIMMSELGAGALQGKHGDKNERWTEEFQANVYIHNLKMLKNIPGLQGLSPWILKDFRSPRRPLKNIQDFWNRKGLLSDKGIKKQAWFVLHDYYQSLEQK